MIYERRFDFRAGLQRFDEIKKDLEVYARRYRKSYVVPFGIGRLFFADCGADDGIVVIDENGPKFKSENVGNYRINVSTSSEVLDRTMSEDIEIILENNNVERIVR